MSGKRNSTSSHVSNKEVTLYRIHTPLNREAEYVGLTSSSLKTTLNKCKSDYAKVVSGKKASSVGYQIIHWFKPENCFIETISTYPNKKAATWARERYIRNVLY